MATLFKTGWQFSQVALISGINQELQYQQAGFALINDHIARGWTAERSSDSVNVGAGNQIGASTEIVHAPAATVHTWILMRPPTNKGAPNGGVQFGMIFDFVEVAADTTPQLVNIILGWGATATNGTTSARATLTQESALIAHNLIPWTAAVAGSFCTWSTADGDLIQMVKANGDTFFRNWFAVRDDPTDAQGANHLCIGAGNSASADAITWASFGATNSWRNHLADGTPAGASNRVFPHANCSSLAWTGGIESTSSRSAWREIEMLNETAVGRNLGIWVDVIGVPANCTFNQPDDEDNGASLPLVYRVVGDLALPCSAAIT